MFLLIHDFKTDLTRATPNGSKSKIVGSLEPLEHQLLDVDSENRREVHRQSEHRSVVPLDLGLARSGIHFVRGMQLPGRTSAFGGKQELDLVASASLEDAVSGQFEDVSVDVAFSMSGVRERALDHPDGAGPHVGAGGRLQVGRHEAQPHEANALVHRHDEAVVLCLDNWIVIFNPYLILK